MLCSKCNTQNQSDSKFCRHCGSNLEPISEQNKRRFTFTNKKSLMTIFTVVVVLVVSTVIFLYINNPIRQFKSEISSNDYAAANTVYQDHIKGNTDDENAVNSFLQDELSNIKNDYLNESIDFDTAITKLETIEKTDLVSDEVDQMKDDIEELHGSRIAYKKGLEHADSDRYIEAIQSFDKVIEKAVNYESAQEKIDELSENAKSKAIKTAENHASDEKLEEAIAVLDDVHDVLPNDTDIISKKETYEEELEKRKQAEREKKIRQAKEEQIVTVNSTQIVEQSTDNKILYPDMIQVIMKNISDKTIKSVKVGMLGFDENGYPVKIEGNYDFSGGQYEYMGFADNVNIVAGDTFGHNSGWELAEEHSISEVMSCVKNVTFYDGSTWTNPYYKYWIEQYKEKPLS
ncbi:hypothetical protein J416_06188 [Gracilibacillus halophilus YIM-C55.5]|uniref:Zinc-ribbon domain-containing protein n=1 Tax=Gracilibacillus halophilus YIM-C55.5 TaxID=1308866 RepID=N4WBD5_9BACI|nr:DUF5780 domain-containing protein [Gracilibacillus halophilus]ENH97578.1 hypothetical protein J416_06188 [Gracilibacillus halophilus YIM-C55.5]